jgi:glycyl-tRNA synthetase
MLTMQDALGRLATFWAEQGCLTVQPMNSEVGAGTMNPATLLRVLGPEPWRVAYVEPSVRPDDARYGENPNRIQCHTQFQVILKPEPGNPQELYLGSLAAIGVDVDAHDIRFVEDNWASPALGAWGLGWEVWLDGLEITQFTYFQQAGGVNLDPVSVEITYGMERIMMALQGKEHFKDIVYAGDVTYGEIFGQAEYEMSRYYLDDADVAANRQLLEIYAGEARRMIEAGLPVPAYSYVVKCSHAFNVLDARGAVSTADRAAEFAKMRRMAADVATLWAARRAELGHPLGPSPAPAPAPQGGPVGESVAGALPVVLEIGTEELPPAEAQGARAQLERELVERLARTTLAHEGVRVLATPRRLAAFITAVAAREPDTTRTVKGPKVSVAFDEAGSPTKVALGFARGQGVEIADVQRIEFGGVAHLAVVADVPGRAAAEVLAEVFAGAVGALRSTKNMRWRDPGLTFTRPIRWILALRGGEIIPVRVSTMTAGRETRLFSAPSTPILKIKNAQEYAAALAKAGIVLDPGDRRARIIDGACDTAALVGGEVDVDGESALIDQISFLVEDPRPLLGRFKESYLELPEAVLVTVMRKHQRYLPVRTPEGTLMPYFVAVANGRVDVDLVREGNEAVLKARYEDAAYFFNADKKISLAELRPRLSKITFTDALGSMLERADRISTIALALAERLDLTEPQRTALARACQLTKFDLASHMVTEMTSLAGTMAEEYARLAGEPPEVAEALHDMERPRSAGDRLPRSLVGALLSVADRLDLLVGLAATVGLPTGSSDPFALRRAALGLLAVYRAEEALAAVPLTTAWAIAAGVQPVAVDDSVVTDIADFVARRFEQQLIDEGHSVDRIRAVIKHSGQPRVVDHLLAQLDVLFDEETFRSLAAALARSGRIVPDGVPPEYDDALLTEPAEVRLHEMLREVHGRVDGQPDLERFVAATPGLVAAVNTFFDEIFVMDEDLARRAARLGLLATVHEVGARVVDWRHLQI